MRSLKSTLYLSLAILLLAVQTLAPVQAGLFSYPESGAKFKMQIPDGWKTDKTKEGSGEVYTFTSPSGAIKMILKTTRGNADQAINVLAAETEVALKYDVKNVAIAEATIKGVKMPFRPYLPKLNDLDSAAQLNARGLSAKDNQPVSLYFLIFSPDGQLWGWLYGLYSENSPKQEQEQLMDIVKSIKKA